MPAAVSGCYVWAATSTFETAGQLVCFGVFVCFEIVCSVIYGLVPDELDDRAISASYCLY